MPEKRGLVDILTIFLVCIPVGVLAGWAVLQYNWPDSVALIVCSVASLLSEKIVNFFLTNAEYFTALLKRAGENIVEKWTK